MLRREVRRPRMWWPVVADPTSGVLQSALPSEHLSALAAALARRANDRWAQGSLSESWGDVRALLRLGGLVEDLPGVSARFLASGILRDAMDWFVRSLESGAADEALAAAMLEALLHPPVPGDLAHDADGIDRYLLLNALIQGVEERAHPGSGPGARGGHAALAGALRQVNRVFDEVVPLLRVPTRETEATVDARVEAHMARADELARLRSGADSDASFVELLIAGGTRAGPLVGEVAAAMSLHLFALAARDR